MEKKNIATTIAAILTLFFIVISGASVSAYKAIPDRVEVKKIGIEYNNNFSVKKSGAKASDPNISELEVKSKSIGLKPSTGEEDVKSKIPYTVNDQIGSEGAYACFEVTSKTFDYKLILKSGSVSIGSEKNDLVMISIMDGEKESISLKDIGGTIGEFKKSDKPQEITVLVWLDGDADNYFRGADIELTFEIVAM